MPDYSEGRPRRGASNAEILTMLGELRAQTAALMDAQARDSRAATESRARLHSRLDEMAREAAQDRADQVLLKARLDRIEPLLVDAASHVNSTRAMWRVLALIGASATGLGSVAVALGTLIANAFPRGGG